jgi:predicted AAA+ superfamily ATPase
MVGILPERVGSVLSIKNLSADLQVAFETARNWISILENLYFCFCISPYYEGMGKLRLAKKEQKLYLWDWSLVPKDSNRFENLVASRLLKYCHHIEDNEGDSMDLQFVRDATKKEIDFVVMRNAQPVFAVECKTGQQSLSKQIEYYSSRLQIPKYYQVHLGDADKVIPKHNARIIPFGTFCQELDPS